MNEQPEFQPALWRGVFGTIRQFIAPGLDPPTPVRRNGRTALHEAAAGGNLELVKAILESEMRIDHSDESGFTALELAVVRRHTPVVRYLLEQGASPTASSRNLLVYAVENCNFNIVQLLVQHGAGADGEFPIHIAAKNGSTAILKLFLDHNADVNAQINNGPTPLDIAVLQDNISTIQLLLERGGVLKTQISLSSVLGRAITNGNLDFAKLLINAGAKFASPVAQKIYEALWINDESSSRLSSNEPFIRNSKSLIDSNHPSQLTSMSSIPYWLFTCLTCHKECMESESGLYQLPSRVIDVGPPDGSKAPFLYESTGHRDLYVTLSHRWGNETFLQTTLKNIDAHRRQIPSEALSRVMLDAIAVTRYLNIRYLWIDSICIVQDSHRDWSREAQNMTHIYQNSLLTIAASSSDDHSQGFLHQSTDPGNLNDAMRASGALDSRAWVLQEQLLSARMISFTRGGLFWDCVSIAASTAHPSGIPIKFDADFSQRDLRIFKEASRTGFLTSTNHSMVEQITTCWYRIVKEYSARKLTIETDKLIALKGISDRAGALLRDDYVVGLWRSSLWRDLLWFVDLSSQSFSESDNTVRKDVRPRSSTFKAPAWSWASVNDPVSYRWAIEAKSEKIQSEIQVISVDVDSKDLYQHRVSGRLLLQGRLFVLYSPSSSGAVQELPSTTQCELVWASDAERHPGKTVLQYEWYPDAQSDYPTSSTLHGLIVACARSWLYCLVLVQTDTMYQGKYDEFRRVGFLRCRRGGSIETPEPLAQQQICLI